MALALFAFTPRQAEGCSPHARRRHVPSSVRNPLARPPTVSGPRKPLSALGASAPLPAKTQKLPLISEIDRMRDGEKELGEQQEHTCEEGSYPAAWSCRLCTFLNCGLLPACEMCQTRRDPDLANDLLDAPGPGAMPPQEATCEESSQEDDEWVHCEVSSVGSSWLEVDGTNVREEDEDEASTVLLEEDEDEANTVLLCGAESTRKTAPGATSWAARAKTIAGEGMAVKVPAHGTAMPPHWRRALKLPQPREHNAEEEGEEECSMIVDVQSKRLHPQASQSTTQRRGVARPRQ